MNEDKADPVRPPQDAAGGLSLLIGLGPEAVAAFEADLKPLVVAPGQVVIEQGAQSDDVFVVYSGQLLGLLLSHTGREITFAEIRPGHYFGELSALDGLPRSITISAVTAARLGVMSAPLFRLWMAREPRIALNVARELAHRNRLMTERIFGLVVHNVDQRVRVLLSRLAQANGQLRRGGVLYPAPTHDALASYVGANREAVSRVLARLSAEGIIGTGRRRITFLDIEALLAGL